ncbi:MULTISPECIES: hypothetical protein [unclassified Shewanella]|uniref:hypothetical protein n=1 Tax=Shewanella TaxID=22 RepID=UPI0004B4066B|nr:MULTISPECIES: hypothetical protein [unclassified Shewanella]MCK7635828.1 hypothetical protein [Shewanella sp. JNE17]MCK7650999.1 hypothetical protein [Shewanella sp. JNE8]MCK7659203.1 hypothetical protein [Shewanella sp. JNE4-2]UPO32570.1 hypothetical protein MZ182_06960 [Shewanella sp. JNE2]
MRKVYGIGINDIKDSTRDSTYQTWKDMLKRCYKLNSGAIVCKQWLTYSNFKSWYEVTSERIRATGYQGKLELDKDLNCQNGLMYSPIDCTLLPPDVNILLAKLGCSSRNNTGLAGVSMVTDRKLAKPYSVSHRINGKNTRHTFTTPEEAYSFRLGYFVGRIESSLDTYSDMLKAQCKYHSLARLSSIEVLSQFESMDAMVKSCG